MNIPNRTITLLLFTICLIALGGAYWLEYREGLDPCSLCLLERWTLIGVAGFLLISFWFWTRFWSLLAFLGTLIGTGLAGRHVWLQHNPYEGPASCAAGLEQMITQMPLLEAMNTALTQNTDCSIVQFRIFGISLAQWSLGLFIVLSIECLLLLIKKKAVSRL